MISNLFDEKNTAVFVGLSRKNCCIRIICDNQKNRINGVTAFFAWDGGMDNTSIIIDVYNYYYDSIRIV